ncbi:MAG TPA: flagellar biosynthetic protein FliO [Archangium sp.]|uniref:FliO/MopB family protein n=1 Tax=Archangium sp. TaxID=1872627 RepID=UPI002ED9B441
MAVSFVSLSRPALLACACMLLAPLARAEAPAAAQAPAAVQAPTAEPTTAPLAPAPSAALDEDLNAPLPLGMEKEPESLSWMLLRTLLVFGAVLASIYLTLNVGLRKLMGLQGVPVGRPSVVSVVERVPLDQRRSLFVLKAADEYLLVGGAENGLQLLSKLDTAAVERIRSERPQTSVIHLSPFLQKLLARRNATASGATPSSGSAPPSA